MHKKPFHSGKRLSATIMMRLSENLLIRRRTNLSGRNSEIRKKNLSGSSLVITKSVLPVNHLIKMRTGLSKSHLASRKTVHLKSSIKKIALLKKVAGGDREDRPFKKPFDKGDRPFKKSFGDKEERPFRKSFGDKEDRPFKNHSAAIVGNALSKIL